MRYVPYTNQIVVKLSEKPVARVYANAQMPQSTPDSRNKLRNEAEAKGQRDMCDVCRPKSHGDRGEQDNDASASKR